MTDDERERLHALLESMTTRELRVYRDALALDRDRGAAERNLELMRFADERIKEVVRRAADAPGAMTMTERELRRELERLRNLPPTVEDWRDLHETLEAYQHRCLGRAIARSPQRDVIVDTIRTLAGL